MSTLACSASNISEHLSPWSGTASTQLIIHDVFREHLSSSNMIVSTVLRKIDSQSLHDMRKKVQDEADVMWCQILTIECLH